jgi:hypothetical protein
MEYRTAAGILYLLHVQDLAGARVPDSPLDSRGLIDSIAGLRATNRPVKQLVEPCRTVSKARLDSILEIDEFCCIFYYSIPVVLIWASICRPYRAGSSVNEGGFVRQIRLNTRVFNPGIRARGRNSGLQDAA